MSAIADERRRAELLSSVWHIAEHLAHRYFVPGHDRDDVAQLARIGMLEALEHFDGRRDFAPLALVAGKREILSEIRAQGFDRRRANQHAYAVGAGEGGEPLELLDRIADPIGLEQLVEARAELRALADAAASLSALERRCAAAVAIGESYSDLVGVPAKTADNAVQRARRKLRAARAAAIAA